MSVYAADHAGALADVQAAGAAVSFTRENPGTYTESTGLFSGAADTTVPGYAVRVRSDPKQYERLSLKSSEAITLLFTPSTFGSLPLPDDKVTWNSVEYTVKSVDEVSPDGTAILAKVVVAR